MKNIEFLTDPKVIKTLAHPLRVRLLSALDGREASPSQLAEEFGEALGTVSYHVRTLHKLGLLELVGREQQRGAVEHYYTTVQWVIPARAWNALPAPLKRAVHQSMVAQIGDDVSSALTAGGFDEPNSHLTRNVLALDDEGARELGKEVSRLLERASEIEAEAKERREGSGGGRSRSFNLVLMLFGAADRSAANGNG